MIERSTGVTIKREISVANLISLLFLLVQAGGQLYMIATDHQQTKDDIAELRSAERETRETAKTEAARLAVEMAKNIARRDESDRTINASIQAINSRLDALADALIGRRHGELAPAPQIQHAQAALPQEP